MTDIYYHYVQGPRRRGLSFSQEELRHLLIAMLALILAFTIVWSGPENLGLEALVTSIVVVSTGFLLHELGHKYRAQKYGCWAEFRMSLRGLGLALLLSFAGFLFAAPGAVYVQGRLTVEQNGKVSISGPAINALLSGVFCLLLVLSSVAGLAIFVRVLFWAGAYFNAFLGIFNLLPIPPLDGYDVLMWSKPVWALAFAGLAFILALVHPSIFLLGML